MSNGRTQKAAAAGKGEGVKESAPSSFSSPLFGQSLAQKEAFRAYLRRVQAFGEASEVLYLAERATTARACACSLGENCPAVYQHASFRQSAQEAAEHEWQEAFKRTIEAQCDWENIAFGLTSGRPNI